MQFAANREGVIRPTALVGRPGPDWLTGSGPAVPHGLTGQRGGTPLPLTGHLLAIRGGPHWPKGTGLPLTPLPTRLPHWMAKREAIPPPLASRLTPSVPPTLTDWMASHRPPNFTHLPHLPRLTDWGQRVGDWPPMGKGGLPQIGLWPQRGHWPPLLPPASPLVPLPTLTD